MEIAFGKDLAQSHDFTLPEFKNRPLLKRVAEYLFLPFRSQL